ncbi:hypothetical protein Daus18300_001441 [Diaporthe australafricana]|uniref:Uncharacterized protein n=1 Tax=Diaporthe australafricana TaxID=127596 RepID=A0ABR3XWV0_9PEZI
MTRPVPCMTVTIASEYNWFHGYVRRGIHVGTVNHVLELHDADAWWNSGASVEVPQGVGLARNAYFDPTASTAYAVDGRNHRWTERVAEALLRDVREPVEPIMGYGDTELLWDRIHAWRRMLLPRAAELYGRDSPQFRLVWDRAGRRRSILDAHTNRAISRGALPKWSHIRSRIALADKPFEDQVVWRSVFSS